MKKSGIFTVVFAMALTFLLVFESCEKDNPILKETPKSTSECMTDVNIHSQVKDARHTFFLDAQEGWIIGKNDQGTFILLHTTDGGKQWTVINNDLGFDNFSVYNNGSQFKFRFTDSNHGYFSIGIPFNGIDNLYYYTTDGGASWNPVPLPSLTQDEHIYLYGMGVNSTQMVFAALVTNSESSIPSCYKLYFVSNATHAITNQVDLACYILEEHKDYKPREIHFTNSGIINMEVTSSNPYKEYFAHSSNFGATWTYTEVEDFPADHSYMEFVNDKVGYLPVNTGTMASEQPFYKTTDGGKTWTKKMFSIENENGTSLAHFAFADENNGLATRVVSGGLYKTTNGGDSWKRVSCFTDPNPQIDFVFPQDIVYPNVDYGIILTQWQNLDAQNNEDMYQNRVFFYNGE